MGSQVVLAPAECSCETLTAP